VLLTDFYRKELSDLVVAENTRSGLGALIETVKALCEKHALEDLVAAVERTGRYHVPVRNALRGGTAWAPLRGRGSPTAQRLRERAPPPHHCVPRRPPPSVTVSRETVKDEGLDCAAARQATRRRALARRLAQKTRQLGVAIGPTYYIMWGSPMRCSPPDEGPHL